MTQFNNLLISLPSSIKEAIVRIDSASYKILLVVDSENHLIGTVTDGDIRRGLLQGIPLTEPLEQVMNVSPHTVSEQDRKQNTLELMDRIGQRYIPKVDSKNCVIGIEVKDELIQPEFYDNWVILMAGGLGSRLKPLTDNCPKPLLKIGDKSVLEIIIENFKESGFHNFLIAVNYKAEMIKEYFSDGRSWGVNIQYIHETERLGTAGALSLLPSAPTKPFLVMNGDLLTKVDFQHLLDFHLEHQAKATMCVREYDFQVPYGVVNIVEQRIVDIDEKPVHRFFVNAGIYVLDPEALSDIPTQTFFDMPQLFERIIAQKEETRVFPIHEYWLDIGKMEDFKIANREYRQ
jgi:dTDP-glucose pyrophosphorylase